MKQLLRLAILFMILGSVSLRVQAAGLSPSQHHEWQQIHQEWLTQQATQQAKARSQARVCGTRVIVTTPQTVAFYVGAHSHYRLGITGVGQWLYDGNYCYEKQPLVAITWDKQGRPFRYRSKEKLHNVNNIITVQFPRDFKKAPLRAESVRCQMRLSNNSAHSVSFFLGSADLGHKIATIPAWHTETVWSPCAFRQRVYARIRQPQGKGLNVLRYGSKPLFSTVNQQAIVQFPAQFAPQQSVLVPLSQRLLDFALASLL